MSGPNGNNLNSSFMTGKPFHFFLLAYSCSQDFANMLGYGGCASLIVDFAGNAFSFYSFSVCDMELLFLSTFCSEVAINLTILTH